MIVELVGARLLAPVFGNTLYCWSALIGVVLLSMSAGGYLGGYLADRGSSTATLALLMLVGSLSTALIPLLSPLFAGALNAADLLTGPLLMSLGLFAVPAFALAAIPPLAIRSVSSLDADRRIGSTAGIIAMFGTAGSFIGTLAAGFLLIPLMRVRIILVATALVLAMGAIALRALAQRRQPRKLLITTSLALVLSTLPLEPLLEGGEANFDIVWRQQTFYHRVTVYDSVGASPRVRYLELDTTVDGAQLLDGGDVVLPYQESWHLVDLLPQPPRRVLFFGGGAFTMPQRLSLGYPDASIDVIELDPAVIAVGKRFFALDDFPNVRAQPGDARRSLRMSNATYDFIFGDAYNGVRYIPSHLVTEEFFRLVKQRLDDDGLYAMNVVGVSAPCESRVAWRIAVTLRNVFDFVYLLPTQPEDPSEMQGLVLVAADRSLEADFARHTAARGKMTGMLAGRMTVASGACGEASFTDDFNPVESLVARELATP
jgi:spermidine synthase